MGNKQCCRNDEISKEQKFTSNLQEVRKDHFAINELNQMLDSVVQENIHYCYDEALEVFMNQSRDLNLSNQKENININV